MNILILGDIMGASGRKVLINKLPDLINNYKIDFVVVNGENASDDGKGITIVSASSLESDQKFSGTNIEGASKIGTLIADRAIKKGVESVVFDRGGYKYHGRVKALAEAARSAGLKF